jgi:hypothetical protein
MQNTEHLYVGDKHRVQGRFQESLGEILSHVAHRKRRRFNPPLQSPSTVPSIASVDLANESTQEFKSQAESRTNIYESVVVDGPKPPTYTLLLGKHWMKNVGLIGYYERDEYNIRTDDRRKSKFQRQETQVCLHCQNPGRTQSTRSPGGSKLSKFALENTTKVHRLHGKIPTRRPQAKRNS